MLIDFLFSLLILGFLMAYLIITTFLFFIIQPKCMCERNTICTNNASSSLSSLSQLIITIPYPPNTMLFWGIHILQHYFEHRLHSFDLLQIGQIICFMLVMNSLVAPLLAGLYAVESLTPLWGPDSSG